MNWQGRCRDGTGNERFSEKPVALVTGGAVRVGRAIVRELAARGYRVAIHANTSLDRAQELVEELNNSGSEAAAFGAESARRRGHARDDRPRPPPLRPARRAGEQRRHLVADAARHRHGRRLRRFFEVNTISTFVCCQHAGLIMAEQEEGGAIVNIGDWAIARPYRDYSAYFISKGAIPTLTRMFAVELAPRGARERGAAGPGLDARKCLGERARRAIAGTLLGRAGRPENVAHAVVVLLENDFITGVCLPVDGGRTIGETA